MTSELKVDKITPASGTNTQIGEAGDTTNLSAGTVTLPTSIITGASEKTTLVDADKFLIADSADSNAFKHVQTSNMPSGKLVETGSLYSLSSNSTNTMIIDNCFTSSYNHYLVNFYCLPANDQAGFSMRYREAGGSPATESSSNYYYASRYFSSGASLSDHYGNGATKIILSDTVCSNEAKGGIWGTFNIRIDADRTSACTFTMNGKYSCADSNTSTKIRSYYHGSFFNAANSTHAIAGGLFFFWESGNTEQFNIKVYGYDGSNA